MTARRIVADVGGSNARFALSPNYGVLAELRAYQVQDYPTFYDALDVYLGETGSRKGCRSVIIGVAGPIDGDCVHVTNSPWHIETGRIETMFAPGAKAGLVNDLEAVALALPHLEDDDLQTIGSVARNPAQRKTMAAVNVGTGFGGATAIYTPHGWIANPGEPGHMTLGARSEEELALFAGDDTVEDYLSGRGLPGFYTHLCRKLGEPDPDEVACAEIFAQAAHDPAARRLADLFAIILGRVSGDIVLAAAAWGGAYLCGSVVNGWLATGGGEEFRTHFESKGPMTERMAGVYTGLITRTDTPLFGVSHLPFHNG
ncbi:MAG: glucokinase [Hyphomicrobiales bacterium]|nr:glucokinase [Hyphomicrobiales bacterium]